ncbi:MAG TPA: molybdopterin-dependent oxidoreductase [Candidatus Cybelea sp.]|jgi:DMSO/TMAO reductase YedYZ molybdopterin-dependent catalytic subunit
MKRRLFVASAASSALAACSQIGTALNGGGFHRLLTLPEPLNHALIGTRGLAQTYPESAISPNFPVNSLPTPSSAQYLGYVARHFQSYRLVVDGSVERPQAFSLDRLWRMPQTSEITRHDCVDGWSAIARWGGVRLSELLAIAGPRKDARYIVFYCMDRDERSIQYYESLDLDQANHPQTLLALRMNGASIPLDYGAPVRLRVPTQLGYKSAKWVQHIEVVGTFAKLYGGNGGYWEDRGYEWYAGI